MSTQQSLEELLKIAAAKEEEAGRFYTEVAENAENPGARVLLLELADEEQKHKVHLENLEPLGIESVSKDKIESLRIAEFLVEKPIKPDSTFQEIMIYAMKREERAERFFCDLSAAMPEGDLKQLFTALQHEETKHKARLEKLYDDVVYKEN